MGQIKKVESEEELLLTEKLADIVWREHYIPIVGKAQIDYMLEKFQSVSAMTQQIKDGYLYYLIYDEDEPAGYFAIQKRDNSLFLSKLYVLSQWRNRGLARQAMAFIEDHARREKLDNISLTVNKENHGSIKAYLQMGFENVGPVVADIGRGYVMDDFKMLKSLTV